MPGTMPRGAVCRLHAMLSVWLLRRIPRRRTAPNRQLPWIHAEQREGLELLRRIGRHVGDEESRPLIVDLQARVAAIFDGWAKGMVAGGRSQALRDTLVHVVGKEYADMLMASLGPAEPEPEQ